MMTRTAALRLLRLNDPFTPEELKQAYREESFAWHPDRFTVGSKMHARAEENYKQIIAAYQYLQQHPEAAAHHSGSTREAEPAQELLLSEEVTYLGGDPRIDQSRLPWLNRRGVQLVLSDTGLTLLLSDQSGQQKAIQIGADQFRGCVWFNRHWRSPFASIDFETYEFVEISNTHMVLQVKDPAGIEPVLISQFKFANAYRAERFARAVAKQFCPLEVWTERNRHQQQKRAEVLRAEQEAAGRKRHAEVDTEGLVGAHWTSEIDLHNPYYIVFIIQVVSKPFWQNLPIAETLNFSHLTHC